jgi:phosphoglucomutase
MTAEMTLYWRSKGKSLLERLDEIFVQHGFHEERGLSKYFEGPTGMTVMRGIMDGYRKSQPATLGGIAVDRIRDVKTGKAWNVSDPGATSEVDLPASDAIQWYLADGTMVTVRPSGTEPKIKYYVLARTVVGAGGLAAAKKASATKVDAMLADIRKVIG